MKASGPLIPRQAILEMASRLVSVSLLKVRLNLREEGVQLGADTADNRNDGHADTGSNQAVLNRGGARFVICKTQNQILHNDSP